MKCETVTISTDAGPVVINKCDFDQAKHKLHKNKPGPKPKAEKAEKADK